MLKENERLDDLEYKNLFIIQNKEGYCFTSDSVILANSARVSAGQRVVDLGTGSGVIALLIAAKTKAAKVYGLEIQERLAEMAERSVKYNGLDGKVEIVRGDIKDAEKLLGSGFDVCVCNPPYESLTNETEGGNFSEKDICKRECLITLAEVVSASERLLKFGGLFYIVYRTKRLAEVIYELKKRGLEPKNLLFIYPKASKAPDTFIIEAKKGAKPNISVGSLTVYNEDGTMTLQAGRIYGK